MYIQQCLASAKEHPCPTPAYLWLEIRDECWYVWEMVVTKEGRRAPRSFKPRSSFSMYGRVALPIAHVRRQAGVCVCVCVVALCVCVRGVRVYRCAD